MCFFCSLDAKDNVALLNSFLRLFDYEGRDVYILFDFWVPRPNVGKLFKAAVFIWELLNFFVVVFLIIFYDSNS